MSGHNMPQKNITLVDELFKNLQKDEKKNLRNKIKLNCRA